MGWETAVAIGAITAGVSSAAAAGVSIARGGQKPKIPPVPKIPEAPKADDSDEQARLARQRAALEAKRRGRESLVINRPKSGLSLGSDVAGLRL
ncbi:MAG TPA: hypothetical protein VNA25_29655 [Phycisphaerae bacterium]|nr:hypothetical protein [Phycisphaerae bacterium]